MKMRAMLKYRLFGVDGITKKEFNNLVQQGVIKKKPPPEYISTFNTDPDVPAKDITKEDTESQNFNKNLKDFITNEGDPLKNNMGFKI